MKGNKQLVIFLLSCLYMFPQLTYGEMDEDAIKAQIEALSKQMQKMSAGMQPPGDTELKGADPLADTSV